MKVLLIIIIFYTRIKSLSVAVLIYHWFFRYHASGWNNYEQE
ncbi:hypothetical protein [Heyndrickxia camelliae]|nr:hypothetical protein [Heyndrickxia camelliae]